MHLNASNSSFPKDALFMMIGGKEETLVSVLLKLAFQCALSADRTLRMEFFHIFFHVENFLWLSAAFDFHTFMDIHTGSSSDPHIRAAFCDFWVCCRVRPPLHI